MKNKPNYKKIYNFVKKKFEKTNYFHSGPFDETYFTLMVYWFAKKVINKLDKKVKEEEVLVSAIFHDVGKSKLNEENLFGPNGFLENHREEWNKHAGFSAEIAEDYLKKNNYPKEFIEEVSYLIKNHDLRGDKLDKRSLELKILQDADLLADIGISGFIRPFLYAGKFDRSIFDQIEYLKEEDRTLEGETLNLEVSKKIAKKEMKTQKKLVGDMLGRINKNLF